MNWKCVFDFQYKVTIGQCAQREFKSVRNKQKQKSDTTSEDQHFMTRKFVFGTKDKVSSHEKLVFKVVSDFCFCLF